MIKAKRTLCAVLFFYFIALSMSKSTSYLPKQRTPSVAGELSKRLLEEADAGNDNALHAQVFLDENFGGDAYEVLSGDPRFFANFNGVISIKVGLATLRIIDWQNNWVYRFAPGEQIKKFKLNSQYWQAFLGKPRCVNSDCVMLFQRPNYSGYFETLNLSDGPVDEDFQEPIVNGMLFQRRYTSFTLPVDDSISHVAILGQNNEFQAFNFRSAFSGDLNYIYIFGDISLGWSYAFTAKTLDYWTIKAYGEDVEIPKGNLFFVSGAWSYARFIGDHTDVTVSRDKRFDYKFVDEAVFGNVRYLWHLYWSDCAYGASDINGFYDVYEICLTGNTIQDDDYVGGLAPKAAADSDADAEEENKTHQQQNKRPNAQDHEWKHTKTNKRPHAGRTLAPAVETVEDQLSMRNDGEQAATNVKDTYSYFHDDNVEKNTRYVRFDTDGMVRAIHVGDGKTEGAVILTSSGVIPARDYWTYVNLIAWEEDDAHSKAYIYPEDHYWHGDAYIVVPNRSFANVQSLQIGQDAGTLFLVQDATPYGIRVFEPNTIVNFFDDDEPVDVISYFELQDVIDYIIEEEAEEHCAYLYNSCDPEEWVDYQKVCIDDETDYNTINLENVKFVAVDSDFDLFTSVLIYREDSFDGQFTLTKSTCLARALSPDMRITLLPEVEDGKVHVYSQPFYTGVRTILNPDVEVDAQVVVAAENHVISLAFGVGSTAKVINIFKKEVFSLDFNAPKYHTHGDQVTIEAGDSPVVNTVEGSLWTFDDKNYQDMRVLYGGHFYGESHVSYRAQYLAFPKVGVAEAILVDRRNSIIQVYDYEPGLVPVDHTTFGGVERVVLIDEDWDSVLLARYANFGEFKQILKRTDIVRLGNNRHYSFVASYQDDDNLRLISWPLLNNLKYNPADAIKDYGYDQYIEQSFTVGLSGLYGFVQGDEWPINVLYDCFITFDAEGDDCTNQTNIRRFCIRSRGIGFENFELKTNGPATTADADYRLLVLLTTDLPEYNISRKYAGITFDGDYQNESVCLALNKRDSYTVRFEKEEH